MTRLFPHPCASRESKAVGVGMMYTAAYVCYKIGARHKSATMLMIPLVAGLIAPFWFISWLHHDEIGRNCERPQ